MGSTPNRVSEKYRVRLAELPPYARDVPDSPMGAFGDVPAACAAFFVELDESEKVKGTFYLYANDEYCRLAGCRAEDILGVSHLEISNSEDPKWPVDCYQAAYCGKTTNGIAYSPLLQSWVCFNIAPAAVKGCCICVFIPFDEQQRTQQMSVDEKTSLVISDLLASLAGEKSFEVAMQDMLEKTAQFTNAERVCVFECYGPLTENTFEWCAEGVAPQIGTVSELSSAVLKAWFKSTVENPVSLIPNTEVIARFSPPLYEWCVESGVKSLMAAPFYNEGEVVGFLGAYNYKLDESVDINRVFSAIRSFVGARIDNRRLIESLNWAGNHDSLTGLLNRRGFKASLEEARVERGDAPVACALIDLDDFKCTNDLYGHASGDAALCAVSKSLVDLFGEDALICRTGGDEFLVCLIGEKANRIEELVDAFKTAKLEYEYEGARRSVAASIGYSKFSGQSFNLHEAFSLVDQALYDNKRESKSNAKKDK